MKALFDAVLLFSLVLSYPLVLFDWRVRSMVKRFARAFILETASV